MLQQLLIGGAIISSTLVAQVLFIGMAMTALQRVGPRLITPPFALKTAMSLIGVVLWLVAGVSICACIWASAFLYLGLFETLEAALYFSIVTFTTLGYGDITLDTQWRLLSGLAAANGLFVFGLNTAFLVEFLSRLRNVQENKAAANFGSTIGN